MKKVEINEEEFASMAVMMISMTIDNIMSQPENILAMGGDVENVDIMAKDILSEIMPEMMAKYMADEAYYFKLADDKMQNEADDSTEDLINKILKDD